MNREEILNKVRSLLRFTPENSTPQEAANAARIAKNLLTKYQLEMQDLHETDPIQTATLYTAQRITRRAGALASAIADAFDCQPLVSNHPERHLFIVGAASDIEIAQYFYQMLLSQLDLAARKEHVSLGYRPHSLPSFLNNYVTAAARQIHHRLKQSAPAPTPLTNALIVHKRHQLDAWLNDRHITHGKAPRQTTNIGTAQGTEKGKTIPLPNALPHTNDTAPPLQLTTGSAQKSRK